ncbi:MAG: hypothetical protein LBM04_11915 [Opitutaceae bacterium]|jgi:hypothetical protein|nr:hypothetical protein [Opitutaceae bacterium]
MSTPASSLPPSPSSARASHPTQATHPAHPSRPSRFTLPVLLVRWTLGLLLLWAGLAKLADPAAFYVNLLTYRLPLLPSGMLRFAAIVFPWLELLTGAGLLLNRWSDAIRPLAVALTALFVLALGQAFLRDLDVSCGCFGRPLFVWTSRPGFALGRALLLFSGALFLHFNRDDLTEAPGQKLESHS